MGDLSITAANVAKGSNALTRTGIAGATITAGQALYLDAAANTLKLADCDTAAALADVVGVALHGASTGQPITYQYAGNVNPGATVAIGSVYVLSGTAGGIQLSSDLANPDRVSIIGVGTTTSNIALKIFNSGAVVPVA